MRSAYLPPSQEVTVNADLLEGLARMLRTADQQLIVGGSWTTDAPFRETERAVVHARSRGLLVVEMEAAGLYAFARARRRDVVCLAHVTNRHGEPADFEKDIAGGATEAFALIRRLAFAWQARPTIEP